MNDHLNHWHSMGYSALNGPERMRYDDVGVGEMISVCMATYNGATYLRLQLSSILKQLGPRDELIIVDDKSCDQTIEMIEQCADERIRLIQNQKNQGVIRAFERAIHAASGELVFLSDQDDIWCPNKVKNMLEVFDDDPTVTLVLSDARIIDSQGSVVSESFFSERGKFKRGVVPNLIKNKFLGCTMAFRGRMKARFLPFPDGIPMHDMWIGIVNELYGKSYFIASPLMAYRRHQNNASPSSRREWWQIIVWRWQLVRALAWYLISVAGHVQSKQ